MIGTGDSHRLGSDVKYELILSLKMLKIAIKNQLVIDVMRL